MEVAANGVKRDAFNTRLSNRLSKCEVPCLGSLRKYEGVPPVETRKPIRFSLSLAGKLDGDDRSGDKGSMVKNGDSTMECLIQSCGDDMDAVRRCLVAGYFANAAKLGSDGRYHTLRGTVPATLHKNVPPSCRPVRSTRVGNI